MGRRRARAHTAGSHAVAGAHRRIEVTVGFFGVGAHFGGVPLETLARESLRQTSQKKSLGDGRLHFEIGERRFAALDRSQPLIDGGAAAFSSTLPPGRRLLVLLRLGIDARAVAIEAGEDETLVADVEDTLAG